MNTYRKDLTGLRSGKLVALASTGKVNPKDRTVIWECRCDCGNTCTATTRAFGRTKRSCGCLHREKICGPQQRRVDHTGKRYGRVLVQGFSHYANKKWYWNFICDCGNTGVAYSGDFTGGKQSCGCLLAEQTAKLGKTNWRGCGEISGDFVSGIRYGAGKRGLDFSLTVEYLWSLFLKQNRKCALTGDDIAIMPSGKRRWSNIAASLDRIDSALGYVEGNVQWVRCDINFMKNKHTQASFLETCKKVVTHMGYVVH